MKKYILVSALATGILLWASWPVSPLTILLFVGFVPLLYLADTITSRKKFFYSSYLAMLIWNIGATWWICNSTLPGGIAAMLANSLLMCIPLMLFYEATRYLGRATAYLAFIAFWLVFEYIHLNWQLSWPWLTLGNGFAYHPDWVQWYEYTGSSGGSLWILVINVLLYESLRRSWAGSTKAGRKTLSLATGLIVIPPLFSLFIKSNTSETSGVQSEIVLLQPNIDPYEKFGAGSQQQQIEILTHLTDSAITPATRLVIWPETALHNDMQGIDLDHIAENRFFDPVRSLIKKHPAISILSGVEGIRFFTEASKDDYSRPTGTEGYYYDSYNAAALLDSVGAVSVYNKSKFVPGVETLPTYLKFMDNIFEQFGGTTGGYVGQKERTVMEDKSSGFKIAPAICYESIYGEFLTDYIRNGANVIVIITNDGWWANTSGHKQHMQYARLRAIETRRWIARSANTGISGFISPTGEILHQKLWDTRATATMTIPAMTAITFFAAHGDLISPVASGLSAVIFLAYLFVRIRRRKT